MEKNITIQIYLPNITNSLNKELLEKQSAITNILKGTPFEKDTNAIFEHLVKVQGALHYKEIEIQSHKEQNQRLLDIVEALIALFQLPKEMKLSFGVWSIDLPQIMVCDTALYLRKSLMELFNNTPSLFNGGFDDDGNQIVLDPNNKSHLKAKKKELEQVQEMLNTLKQHQGRATYSKNTPNEITDTFRIVCAIKIFCKCDGFKKWGRRGNAKRNECIFKCLQVFGYTTIKNTTDEMKNAEQRNYEKKKVNDAEKRNIVFISTPL